MNQKILIIASALMLVSSAVTAEGLYGGVGLGWSDTQYTYIEKETGFGNLEIDYGASGPATSLFGGYRLNLNNDLLLAFEVNVALSSAKGEDKFEDFSFKSEQKAGYGIAALLGSRLGDNLIYGRLGYQMTAYEVTLSEPGFSESWKETHGGIRLGLGAELPLNDRVMLRLDWSRTWHSEETYLSEPGFSIAFEPEESLFQAALVLQY